MNKQLILLSLALLGGCGVVEVKDNQADTANADANAAAMAPASPAEAPAGFGAEADATPPAAIVTPDFRAQVLLDRIGFSSGVIDGKAKPAFAGALKGFQQAHDLTVTGKLDAATLGALDQWKDVPATMLVRIPADFAAGPFQPDQPKDAAAQAKLPGLAYRTLIEALAERFHTTPETLVALNAPGTPIGAGKQIRAPNIPDVAAAAASQDDRGWPLTLQRLAVAADAPQADHVVVDKSDGVLRVLDADDRLIAQFPATMGSKHDPLPLGSWKINGVSRNPDFHYNPKLFWDVSDHKEDQLLPPGPNNPVGVVWIDLSKPHYGIHGTPEPQTIGSAESHGCVRLTNWDAARLAQMVKPGMVALFQS